MARRGELWGLMGQVKGRVMGCHGLSVISNVGNFATKVDGGGEGFRDRLFTMNPLYCILHEVLCLHSLLCCV